MTIEHAVPPLRVEASRAALRDELLSNNELVAVLRQAASRGARLVPSVGNVGDGLIQLGTFDLLASLGLKFELIVGLEQAQFLSAETLVLGGGGGVG